MVDYPVKFSSESKAEKGKKSWPLETDEGLKTEMSVPEEFGGDSENPSPEDLFSASLQTCMIATFKTIAERKNLEYNRIESRAEVTLDRGKDSRPVMKEAEINLEVVGVSDREKAEKVAQATEKNCFIHNSVKTDVTTDFEFRN
ncbi:MAG: OsmC family protein [Candidatus Nanohaloarchaea archaeon]